jgi:flavin-dependent dehydrogenase
MVVDCAAPPIDKSCGEGLMPDSLEVLKALGVSLHGYETGEFRGIKFVGRQESVAADFPHGRARGIRRLLLHEAFVNHAANSGVEMLWRARVLLSGSPEFAGKQAAAVSVNGNAIRSRWIVGADGQNSNVRRWAGLDDAQVRSSRFGLRQHFRVKPWSEYVEIFWGELGQAYVTPIGREEICIALISRQRFASFDAGLQHFPALGAHLQGAPATSTPRGALTVSRKLKSVARGKVALIGEASGSVDAITGEGLAMAFRQALALAPAMANGDLGTYQPEHSRIMSLPGFMARGMLLLDSHAWLRRRALRAFAREPRLFKQLLSVHVGELPLTQLGARGLVNLGWRVLRA